MKEVVSWVKCYQTALHAAQLAASQEGLSFS
jgi:hypothetical protein